MNDLDVALGEQVLGAAFGRVFALPTWRPWKGYASNLFFNFGRPKLAFMPASAGTDAHVPGRAPISSERWLNISMCSWEILDEHGRELAHSESENAAIERALYSLDSKLLLSVKLSQDPAGTVYTFDDGTRLRLQAYQEGRPDEALWTLRLEDKSVSFLTNGRLELTAGNETVGEVPCGAASVESWNAFLGTV